MEDFEIELVGLLVVCCGGVFVVVEDWIFVNVVFRYGGFFEDVLCFELM